MPSSCDHDSTSWLLAVLRAALFGALCVPVVLQAIDEIANYRSEMTSTAMWTERDESMRWPNIVFCMKVPFFGGDGSGPIMTQEQFDNQTYGQDAFFAGDVDGIFGVEEVEALSTWYEGKCFMIKVRTDSSWQYNLRECI